MRMIRSAPAVRGDCARSWAGLVLGLPESMLRS
jgi:hypothetical protein